MKSLETYYEALQLSSKGWQKGKHSLKPWWEYSLGVLIGAYQEFERRVGMITKARAVVPSGRNVVINPLNVVMTKNIGH